VNEQPGLFFLKIDFYLLELIIELLNGIIDGYISFGLLVLGCT
jgi:hypothetical protein